MAEAAQHTPKKTTTVREVIKQFWKSGNRYWWIYTITVIAVIAISVIQIFIPLLYKDFFDILTVATDRVGAGGELVAIIINVLILNIVMWFLTRTATFTDNIFQSWTAAHLRQNAFNNLIEHSYSFFSNSFSGALVQRVNRFAGGFGRLVDQITWNVLPLGVNIVGVIIVVWQIRPLFAIAIFVWIFLYVLFNFGLARFKSKFDLKANEADSKVTALLSDVITNHNAVQLFTASRFEKIQFRSATDDQASKSVKAWNIANVVDSVQASFIYILEFFVFYYAIRYWQAGTFSVGTFVLIQAYIINLADRLWGFSRIIRTVYESFASAKEMVEIMHTPLEIRDVPNAQELVVKKGTIDFKKVMFAFNETRDVVKNISLSIKGGEKVALIGPSGAGKSTIIRLILRLYDVMDGEIVIDGKNIQKVTLESLRSHISLVPQDPVLFHRSIKENIRYGRRSASDEEVIEAAKLAHCHEFIKDLPQGYDTLVGERGVKLSGGERQRVAIARAILKNAPILILDEATSSLDSESEVLIQDALDTLMKGKTVIVIAHRLSTIRKMDRIIVLEEGKIREEGTHESLLAEQDSLYKKLWDLQAGGFLIG